MLKMASGCTDSLHSSPWTPNYPCLNGFYPLGSPGMLSRNKKCLSLHRTLVGSTFLLPPWIKPAGRDPHFLKGLHFPALRELMSLLKLLFLLIQAPMSCGRKGSRAALLQSSTWSNQPHWKPLWVSLCGPVLCQVNKLTQHICKEAFSALPEMCRHRLSH